VAAFFDKQRIFLESKEYSREPARNSFKRQVVSKKQKKPSPEQSPDSQVANVNHL
jgi:hypothetical protein